MKKNETDPPPTEPLTQWAKTKTIEVLEKLGALEVTEIEFLSAGYL
jgi:hypothetical protein